MSQELDTWLERFEIDAFLRPHVARVFLALPESVREDIVSDPGFAICDYEPGTVLCVPMGAPGRNRPGRSVVLKRTLRHRPTPFVLWLIAHEVAHAHLRHAGRWPGDDPEHAADALAAEWGFPRPGWG